ncbi:hypothetical protein ACHAW5_002400 [Stephanodiscus triporus]|uniref:K+ potassium transporter integral membrane domain-containing protein n=1 Tax=Stephanodiscus triporus TaxID=2934178 RepID=A0ABD3NQ42_9STRA
MATNDNEVGVLSDSVKKTRFDVAVEDAQLQRAENQPPERKMTRGMSSRAALTIDARKGGGDGLPRAPMERGVSTRAGAAPMARGVSTRGGLFIGGNDIGEEEKGHSGLCMLVVGALGVVFGDIGTSPLYTINTITHNIPIFEGDDLEAVNRSEIIVAVFCLIFYTLIWIVSFKYVLWVMKVNHEGNGGGLAMAQVIMASLSRTSPEKKDNEDESDPTTTPPAVRNNEDITNSANVHQRKTLLVMTLAIVSACFLISDGIITPPNTVLGALTTPVLKGISTNVNVLISVVILLITFGVQKFGSKAIGLVCGPLMILWFATLAILGILAIARYPEEARFLSRGFNPACLTAFTGTAENPPIVGFQNAFLSFAGVILCVTGAEALYADLGHFGYKAISLAWTLVVFPALTIQYYGQCCHVISLGRDTSLYPSSDYETAEYQALVQERQLYNTKLIEVPNDLVYALIPTDVMPYMAGQACLWLLTILAVLAAIIASQALISGLFSILTQAYALDIVPRLTISHTNPDEKGQVYISEANSMMCVVCILIVLVFQSSEKLLSAYGIAVAFCMFLTDLSMGLVVVWVYNYHWAVAVLICVPFIFVDGLFLASNSVKLSHGTESWLTIAITLVLWFFMPSPLVDKTNATRMAQAAHARQLSECPNQEVTTADIENLLSLLKDSRC